MTALEKETEPMMLTLLVVLGVVVGANAVVLSMLGAQYHREVARRQRRELLRSLTLAA